MKRFIQFAAVATVLAGVFGMLFCLPFLFSTNMADLVGAGFPFIGGAVLVVGGLMSLSILTKDSNKSGHLRPAIDNGDWLIRANL